MALYALNSFPISREFCRLLSILLKETKSATMNIFQKIFFSKNGVCKSRIKLCFHNKSVYYNNLKLHVKVNYLIKQVCFSLVGNYLRPSNNSRQ